MFHFSKSPIRKVLDFSGVGWSRWIDGMHCSGVQWNGVDGMQCSGVEWNGCILSILGPFGTFGSILGHVLDKKKPFQNVVPSGRICWLFFRQKNAISKCRTFGPDLLVVVVCPKHDPTNPARRYDILKWRFCCETNDQKCTKRPKMLKCIHSIPFHCIAFHRLHSIALHCIAFHRSIDSIPLH